MQVRQPPRPETQPRPACEGFGVQKPGVASTGGFGRGGGNECSSNLCGCFLFILKNKTRAATIMIIPAIIVTTITIIVVSSLPPLLLPPLSLSLVGDEGFVGFGVQVFDSHRQP